MRITEAALTLRKRAALAALALASFAPCLAQPSLAQNRSTQPAPAPESASWQQDLNAWRAQRERDLDAPDGWLALAGLEWLNPGVNSIGAAADNRIRIPAHAPDHIGLLTVQGNPQDGGIVQLLAPSGGFPAGFHVIGGPPHEGQLNVSDNNPSTMTWHGLSLVVLRRADRFVLRIKDADAPTRTAFHGLHWYAPDPGYRVTARWIPYNPPQIEKIPTVLGTTLDMTAPGVAEFLLKGQVYLLEPVIESGDAGQLFFILSDATSATTTYPGGRFLHSGLPDHGLAQPGNLTLDFNRLYNPPCAYTVYATCPLPPQKNRLPVAIEAGEQRYPR